MITDEQCLVAAQVLSRNEGMRVALEAAEKAAWQPISVHPPHAMMVELYSGDVTEIASSSWEDGATLVTMHPITAERDYRRSIGFWDAEWKCWRELNSGHDCFEPQAVDNHPEWLPTHWRPLPEPPESA